ncbi:DeoR/GlpR family DNA-binding transcription regulator [Nigerium massiliense]|uniref:DeoR/GlpR family DNA-binding transcription regulator n=1 Tax=Nigerium massiliense TaxID=1522317 RepID=UPI000694D38B|nr:DeoR/GlpR family DNA-binding transcription regulator [Nigerium massiliense]
MTNEDGASPKQLRQNRMAALIFQRGTIRVDALQEITGVSPMTLYRDLAELESRHVIHRSRGEVSAAASSLSETPFHFRLGQEVGAKTQLADLAATLVQRGDSLLVDDSTSAHFVLEKALGVGQLTVVTNCQGPASLVATQPNAELILLGGRYLRQLQAFYGPAANQALDGIRVDIAVTGAAAIENGIVLHPYEDVATFKRRVLGRTRRSVLVVTRSKFTRRALYEVCTLSDFDVVVTDLPADDPQLDAARDAGVHVITPPAAPEASG